MARKVGDDRLTHLQRIRDVYPFLYTLAYRANRGWLPSAGDPYRPIAALTFLETVVLMLWAVRLGLYAGGHPFAMMLIFIALGAALYLLNEDILLRHGIGVRFEEQFDLLVTSERAWLAFYSLIVIALCFAPAIGLARRFAT